ncbi:MAG: histidine kinase [Bacteroidetes bacterium]|nr:histidine kinase [Bacteroidota bacterium]MBP6426125.1 histidine kinase [Bacteroidia bacterium]
MNDYIKGFLTGILFSFLSIQASAQHTLSKSFDIRTEGVRPKFTKLFCDSKGLIWTGTDKGIFTFDGINFSKLSGSDSLAPGIVTAMYEDRSGLIWVGFDNGKLVKIGGRTISSYNPQEGFPKSAITAFAENKSGVLFFATKGEGVYCIEKGIMYNIDHDDNLSDDYCYAMILLPDGRICVGTDEGINFIEFSNGVKKVTSFGNSQGLPDDIVRSLTMDKSNRLWLGFQDKGICIFDYVNNKISFQPEEISKGQINSLLSSGDILWVNTEENGILKYDKYGKSSRLVSENNLQNRAIDIIADLENNIWLAESIHLTRTSGDKIISINSIDNTKINFIHCVITDKKGGIWFCPDRQLSHMYRDKNGEWEIENFKIIESKEPADIVTLYEDIYGFIWVGSLGEGVYRFNPATGKVRRFNEKTNIEESSILSITGDGDEIWIGGFNGVSKFRIVSDGASEKAVIVKDTLSTKRLTNDYVYSVFIDSKKRIWFGTDEQGLYYLKDGEVVNLPLNHNSVHSFTEDIYGKIWFSMPDAGLGYFYDNKINFFSAKDGLSDPSPVSLLSMKNGKLIIVHSNGFDILDPKTLKIIYHSSEENLADINSDLNSIAQSPDSSIWIGTEKGLINYQPFSDLNISEPALSFSGVSVFLKNIETNQKKFSHEENNLRFDLNGLWYSDPQRVNYSFYLEGYSNKWENTKDKNIVFSKLSPGNYTLKVRSSLNSNFNLSKEITYTFEITPPYWQTWWFRGLFAFVVALLLVLIIRRRENRLRKLDLLQKEKIEFQFETLKNQVNPHFLFNSFNTLVNVIETDSKSAVQYVQKLSEFFRSIVNYRDKNLIFLEEEISLLENYIFIQKERYGDNLKIKIDLDKKTMSTFTIPPLTLQLLAENALKHNAISKETPLQISLISENGRLVIRNNINRKISKERSSGMGLQNIVNRYRLLTKEKVEIDETVSTFTVSLPMLNPQSA